MFLRTELFCGFSKVIQGVVGHRIKQPRISLKFMESTNLSRQWARTVVANSPTDDGVLSSMPLSQE